MSYDASGRCAQEDVVTWLSVPGSHANPGSGRVNPAKPQEAWMLDQQSQYISLQMQPSEFAASQYITISLSLRWLLILSDPKVFHL